MNLEEMKKQLIEWIGQMKFGYRDPEMYMYEEKNRIRILLFTLTNKYQIVAVAKEEEGGRDYLGAWCSCRTPRAGEDWTRGNDLADGDFCLETWIRILSDIVGSELVRIHVPIRNLYMEEEKEGHVSLNKPIDTIQHRQNNWKDVYAFITSEKGLVGHSLAPSGVLTIRTRDGVIFVNRDDWIVRDDNGKLSVRELSDCEKVK